MGKKSNGEKERCAYCNYEVATTKDHILPKHFVKTVYDSTFPHYKMPTNNGDNINIVSSCRRCNGEKGDRVIFPTREHIADEFRYFSFMKLKEWATWLYFYRYGISIVVNGELKEDWDEFCSIMESGELDNIIIKTQNQYKL